MWLMIQSYLHSFYSYCYWLLKRSKFWKLCKFFGVLGRDNGQCRESVTKVEEECSGKFSWIASSQNNSWNSPATVDQIINTLLHARQCENSLFDSGQLSTRNVVFTYTYKVLSSLASSRSQLRGVQRVQDQHRQPPSAQIHTHTYTHTHCLVKGPFVHCCFFRGNTLFISLWGI